MKPILLIKALAIGLIILFAIGTLGAAYAFFTVGASFLFLFAIIVNLGFVMGGIGLFKLKRWGWWLTIGLCAISIVELIWQLFTKLTPQNATNQNEIVSFIVAGFYLAIISFLIGNSVRKIFREHNTVA